MNKLRIKNFLMLTIAGIINAFGVTVFLAPVKLYDSGISGTSMFLDRLTPEFLTLSIFLIVLNIPLFLFGLKKQGVTFTIYAIYAVCIYSLFAWLITDVLPIGCIGILMCSFVLGVSTHQSYISIDTIITYRFKSRLASRKAADNFKQIKFSF